jgi:subtilase family serine protease
MEQCKVFGWIRHELQGVVLALVAGVLVAAVLWPEVRRRSW